MNTKAIRPIATAVLAILVTLAGSLSVRAAEKNEKAEVKAPAAVVTAFQAAYPRAKILDVSIETVNGKDYYEIESQDGATRRDLLYTADGAVYQTEELMGVADLPLKVTESVLSKYPAAKMQKAEKITRAGVTEYEVLAEVGEDNLEILVSADGQIKSQANAGDQDEESGGAENDEADED